MSPFGRLIFYPFSLFLVLFCCLANPAGATIALVANTCAGSTNTNSVTTSGINTTGATLIVLTLNYPSAASFTLTDSNSNTWTALTSYASYGAYNNATQLYYVSNPTTSSSQTFTLSGSSIFPSICVLAFSGTASAPFDVKNGAANTSTTSLQTGNVSPSTGSEVVVTGVGIGNGGGTYSINGSFTVPSGEQFTNTANAYGAAMAYLIQTTATAENPTWSISGATTISTAIATFEATTAEVAHVGKAKFGGVKMGI